MKNQPHDASPNSRRVFIACLLSFSILMTPFAAMAARSQRSEARGQRSDNKATTGSSSTKATANGTFANPAPAMPAASPIITASMTDSIENDDGDTKIDPTDGTGSTERIIYSTTISNTGTVAATGLQFADTIDSHTTLVGGSLNISPLAGDDSYDTIGNTLLEVGPVGSPSAQPKVTVTGSVFDNDTEFLSDTFTLSKLQATTFVSGTVTAASASGSVTMDGTGKFSYTPNAGFTGADTFTYTIKDAGNLESTATVTINVNTQRVWYVQNNAAPGGLGRSTDPFDTLVEAQTASAAGDTIYVFAGNGTTSGQNAGITLKANQRFIGNGVQLDVPVSVNGGPNPTVLRAAGAAPMITNAGGDGVTVLNISGVSIRGFNIAGSNNAIDVTTSGASSGGVTISNNAISAAGAEGIDVNTGGSGTLTLDVNTNTLNATGNAFDVFTTAGTTLLNFSSNTGITSANGAGSAVNIVRNAGALTITGFANNAVSGNAAGTGINVTAATFDANPGTVNLDQVSGGTTVIGAAGNGVGDSGLILTGMVGDLSFTDLDVVNDNGTGLSVSGAGQLNAPAGTGSKISIGVNVGVIASTGGPAVNVSSATADLQLSSLTSTNSGSQGVLLTTVNGTFSAPSGSSITNATNEDFGISGGTANVTYGGTITDDLGTLVSVGSTTGGTKSFTGAITDGNDGDGSGISLTNNAGATIRFSGGLVLSTGANPAFTATGGATAIEVCDESPCNPAATGALVNTLTTTTGIALNVANTTIGANGLEFRSVSSNGASSGIVLNSTGALGSLTVKGNGGGCTSAGTCTGGAIQNSTSHGVSLTTTLSPSFTRLAIQTTAGNGVSGTDVTNFTFQNGFIDNSGTGLAAQVSNIAFNTLNNNNVDGVVSIINNTLTNAYFHGVAIENYSGTITSLDISNNTITSSTAGGPAIACPASAPARNPTTCSQGNGIHVIIHGTAAVTSNLNDATVSNNIITNFPLGGGIIMQGTNAAAGSPQLTFGIPNDANNIISITGNRVAGASSANKINTNAIQVSINGTARGNWEINNNGTIANPITNIGGNVISTSVLGNSTGTVTINNNRIVANHTPNFGGPFGISAGVGATFGVTDVETLTLVIDGNNVSQTDGNGIKIRGAEAQGTINVRISNNTVAAPLCTCLREGIFVEAGGSTAGTDNDVCVDIVGNTTAGATDGFDTAPGIRLRKQGTSPTVNAFSVEGMAATATPGVEQYVGNFAGGKNPGSANGTYGNNGVVLGSATSGFSNCSAAPLRFANGGVYRNGDSPFPAFDVFDDGAVSLYPALAGNSWRHSAAGNASSLVSLDANATGVLTQTDMDHVVAAAIDRWSATGLTLKQIATLRAIKFEIADLQGAYLGEAAGSNRILVDRNAGGRGWFIDATPMSDLNFAHAISATRLYTDPTSLPAGHVDLLTAIEHEIGHKLGLNDSYAQKDRNGLMYGYLTVGERRLPASGEAKAARKGSPSTHFLTLAADDKDAVDLSSALKSGMTGIKSAEVRDQKSEVRLNQAPNAKPETRNSKLGTSLAPMPPGPTVNETIGTLPAGKSITIVFKVTLNNLPNLSLLNPPRVSNQATISGGNFTSVLSDDSTVGGASDPNETPADLFNTTTVVGTSGSPSSSGDSLTFTATVTFNPTGSPTGTPGTPTGSVQFKDGVTNITCDEGAGARPLNGSGVATCTTSTLSSAVHTINADYLGDGNFDTSTGSVSQTVIACNAAPVVTKIADTDDGICDGDCSLREAISSACTGATITFDTAGVFATPQTITLSLGELSVARNMTIDGPDAAGNHVTVSGGVGIRGFNVASGKTDTIRELTITGVNVAPGDAAGGILNAGTLTLINCTVNGNTATEGGGIYNGGTLTVINSTISGNNSATFEGGGIVNNAVGVLNIINSTVSGNNAATDGGGIWNGNTLTVINSTISNNRADLDNNASGTGGGIFINGGTAVLRNTIVAGNFNEDGVTDSRDDINGPLDAAGINNLIGDGTNMTGISNADANSNQVGSSGSPIDAMLGVLANNGGVTFTHALLPGSPAIDAGDNTAATNASLTTDQRGTGFPRIADSADLDTTATVDIGAFELHPSIEDIQDTSTNEDTVKNVVFNLGDDTGTLITGGGGSVTATSSNTTLVPNANLSFTGSAGSRTLQITPAPDQSGSTTITVTVTATNGRTATDTFDLTVNAVNDNPNVTGETIGNIAEDCSSGCTSGKYVVSFASLLANDNSGPADESGQTITITAVGSASGGTVAINGTNVEFTPTADYNGAASFQYTVTDNGAPPAAANGTASFTITEVNDAPVATDDVLTSVNEDSGLRTIPFTDLTGNDSKGAANESGQALTITNVTNAVGGTVNINGANVEFTPTANFNGTASFDYTVSDDGTTNSLADPKTDVGSVSFTVTAIADTPSVTNSSTNEDTQTTTGLVISRNAADGVEVTHFKITSITNGTLFQNDGTTPINNGDFITFAEGNAGLRFTPALNFSGNGTFQVQAATDGAGSGLSTGFATATIAVGSVADVPGVTNATTDEDTQSTSGLVITPNANDSDVTHFKITAITNGTLFQNDGSTAINNNDFITLAQGAAGLRFTPSANLYSSVSTFSFQVQGATNGSGAGLGNAATASITVNPIADDPSISPNPQTTAISTQTGPMVISRNAADGTEVTHFKITNITNGTLFQNDGATAINNNDFITFAQGNAGLKFTPTAGLSSPGNTFGFDVQASVNNTNGGLGGSPVNEDIIVSCSDPQVVTSTLDDGSAGTLRYAIANSCPATGTITFNLPAGPQTILLASELTIAKTLTIIGPANQAVTVSGGGNRVFSITGGGPSISNLTITGALVSGSNGGGLLNTSSGTVTLNGLTFTGNSADNGGAIATTAGTVVINNSTISGNTATTEGGGLYVNGGTLTLLNDTITNNTATAGQGGGLRRVSGTVNVQNTIIAGNTAPVNPDVVGSINDQGNNILSGDAKLAPLANNGGPTQTHALLPGSPALDAGDNAAASSLTTDQRGNTFGRLRDAASDADTTQTVDIGAFEADPSVEDISDKATGEDTPLPSFSFNVGDAFSAFDSITVTSSNTTLVPNANINLSGSGSTRSLDITPAANVSGTTTITVTVSKTINSTVVSMSDTFVLTVSTVPDTPSVSNTTTNEDTQSSGGLVITKNVADGAEVTHFKITNITGGTLFKNDGVTVIANNSFITEAEGGAGLRFTPAPNSIATGTFQVQGSTDAVGTALSPSAATGSIFITPIADTPSVTNTTTNEDTQTTSGLVISRNAVDGAEVTHFKITGITGGTLFKHDGTTAIANNSFITVAEGNAGLRFTPAPNSIATGSFQAQSSTDAVGTSLSGAATGSIFITPIADTPSVTNATTNEDTQSTSGLVITRNANDGAEVTHFRITNIVGGTLFKNDGVTPILDNNSITAAEGGAGLKFTPSANLRSPSATFSFAIKAATNAGGAGASSSIVAVITVIPVADTPSVTNATTNEDTQTTAGLVLSRNVVDSGEVTHFKITGITGGTLFKHDGATAIANGSFITFAEGNAGLRFTPTANLFSPTTTFSFKVQAGTDGLGGGLSSGMATATITVNAVADTPSVTNATTNEDTQTTSGLVITRNANDGAEVTHFKITGITGGTLFKHDGTTAIANGGFITFAEGNAGLRFTPTASLFSPTTTFSFNVQGATNGSGAGLSGTATATITVNSVNDVPSFTKGADQTVTENANAQSITNWATGISAGAANESGQTLTFQVTGNTNPGLFAAQPIVSSTGTLSYIPGTHASGTAAITILLKDNGGTANGGVDTSAPQTFNITINDGGTLQFSATTYSVGEGSGPAVITINRTGGTAGTATVLISTSNGTATGADYTSITNQLVTFNDGETSKTVNVTITNDLFNETNETINLTLSGVGGSGQLGSPSTAGLTINDDDAVGGYIKFSSATYSVAEGGVATITVQRVGTLTQAVTVDFATTDNSNPAAPVSCAPTLGNTLASSRCDFTSTFGRISFAAGDGADKTFTVLTDQDSYVEGPETLTLTLSNATGGANLILPSTATLTINDDVSEPAANPVDDTATFVEQLYRDFLNRSSDPAGKAFWVDNIDKCHDPGRRPAGLTEAQCIEVQRINTAASFFLSIEFQATGGTAYLANKAAYNGLPTFSTFEADAQAIGKGYVFGQPGAEAILEANKVAYFNEFVTRTQFTAIYNSTTNAQYVDALIANTGVTFTPAERDALVNGLNGATETRPTVLRKITEKASFHAAEFNSMFVLMEYFGFLRRNADAAGFNFWLDKLNTFNGDYIAAEMIKAFITSSEYRGRFGP